MLKKLDRYYTTKDSILVDYSKLKEAFLQKNIKIHHAIKNKDIKTIKVFKEAEFESDSNFFGRVTHLPSIGAFSYTISNLDYGIKIGRYCSLARNIQIMGAHHFPDWISTSPVFYRPGYHDVDQDTMSHTARTKRRVNIGNDVWIGANVVLKSDLNIGDGAIIASNSVVTKDVPPYMIVGGIPAKIIRPRFNDELIKELQKSEWWRYHKDDFNGMNANKPFDFLQELNEKISSGQIKEYCPSILKISDIYSS